jgi:hypothetical protein
MFSFDENNIKMNKKCYKRIINIIPKKSVFPLIGASFLFCQLLIPFYAHTAKNTAKNNYNKDYNKIIYSKKLYRTHIYIEHFKRKENIIFTLRSRVSGTRFFFHLKKFKRGSLVFEGNYEFKPFRYYEFIKKIDKYFFKEQFTTKKIIKSGKEISFNDELKIWKELSDEFTPWEKKYQKTKNKPSFVKPDTNHSYFHIYLHYYDTQKKLKRYIKKTFNISKKRSLQNKVKYTINYFNEFSIPRQRK